MKRLSAIILSLMVMTQVVRARNEAALFGIAAAAIAGAALIANSNKAPQKRYYHEKKRKKKSYTPAPVVVTDEMRIQKSLTYLEFYKGSIDGQLNSYSSRNAIKKLNQQYGISQGTTLESRTWDQLIYLSELFEMDKYLFADATTETTRGKQLQAALKAYGVYDSEIDGVVGGGTKQAIARYKEQQGLGQSTYISSNERYNLIESAQKMNADNINQAINDLSPQATRVPQTRVTPTNMIQDDGANMGNGRDLNQNSGANMGNGRDLNQNSGTTIPNSSRTIPMTREVPQTTETPQSREVPQATQVSVGSSVNAQAPVTQEVQQESASGNSNQKDLEEMENALNSTDKE